MNPIHMPLAKICFSLFLVATFCFTALAQPKIDGSALARQLAGEIDTTKMTKILAKANLTLNANPAWNQKKIELEIFHMNHEIRAYQFQFYTSIAIFIMVLVIVGLGLYLSYRQFTLTERLSAKTARSKRTAEGETAAKEPLFSTSSLSLSKDGFTISTAVIGLIILIISLAFFFLYLDKVYKIDIQ